MYIRIKSIVIWSIIAVVATYMNVIESLFWMNIWLGVLLLWTFVIILANANRKMEAEKILTSISERVENQLMVLRPVIRDVDRMSRITAPSTSMLVYYVRDLSLLLDAVDARLYNNPLKTIDIDNFLSTCLISASVNYSDGGIDDILLQSNQIAQVRNIKKSLHLLRDIGLRSI